jgi:hypothetical protein
MKKLRAAILVCAIPAITACTSITVPADNNPNANSNGGGLSSQSAVGGPAGQPAVGASGGKPAVGTPGPIAGAGLVFLAAGGGYLLLRYRKRKTGHRPD